MSSTPYVSLANKYRPQTFEDMVGQESISKTLQNALKSGRIAHAYLFYGPRGCGKTTTARILAKALNCTGNGTTSPTPHPCGQCSQCTEIAQSSDLDVLELDAASNTQVEKVREAIIDTVALAASRDRFKVFILDEVHMLSASSFNALLKTIEEPPAHVVFILATTEKHKVPATIVSRCQTFRFRPIAPEVIAEHLLRLAKTEQLDLTPGAAKIIAKNAGGAMRDALTLLDRAIAYSGPKIDETLVGELLGLTPQDLIKQTVAALVNKENQPLHRVFETLKAEGFDANSFLKDLKNALGDAFYFTLGQGTQPFDGAADVLKNVSPGFLAQLSRKINKLSEEIKFSDNALVSAEVGLFTVMDSCLDIEGFVRRLEALERGETVPPSTPKEAAPLAAKESTAKKQRPLQAAATQPQEQAPLQTAAVSPEPALTDRQLWDKLVKHFEKSFFVYDVMSSCQVEFNDTRWVLRLPADKAFYQIPAQHKLPEIEQAARELSGKNIRLELAEVAQPIQPAPAAKPAKKTTKKAPAARQTAAELPAVSDDEPFVQADFSADVQPGGAVLDEAPEELKDLLNVIPGDVLA